MYEYLQYTVLGFRRVYACLTMTRTADWLLVALFPNLFLLSQAWPSSLLQIG